MLLYSSEPLLKIFLLPDMSLLLSLLGYPHGISSAIPSLPAPDGIVLEHSILNFSLITCQLVLSW